MLTRVQRLWRPPTCVLSGMAYELKRRILGTFKLMNEQLFDALPSMMTDEKLSGGMSDAPLSETFDGPGPYQRNDTMIDGVQFVDGMRVTATKKIAYPPKCVTTSMLSEDHSRCVYEAHTGEVGTVHLVGEMELTVIWDSDKEKNHIPVTKADIEVMPHGWAGPKGISSRLSDVLSSMKVVKKEAKKLFGNMLQHKYQGLATMMSDAVSKWAVCPIRGDANLTQLDAELGIEDAAFADFKKDAYSKWTGYKRNIPGESCVKANTIGLANAGDFEGCRVCDISELQTDYVERYVDEEGRREDFICPVRPPLPSDEQLQVLLEKTGQCLLHMTAEQDRQYHWLYQGDFPGRRQNEKQVNLPRAEFELLKLINVEKGGENSAVSYGRYCTLEELKANPRFCAGPKLQNPWPSAMDMAKDMARMMTGALGVSASAIAGSISSFRDGLAQNHTLKSSALWVGEAAWEKLTGIGRVAGHIQDGLSTFADALPTEGHREAALQDSIFGSEDSGQLLHDLGFQRSTGTDDKTTNGREQYARYVMTCPCRDFDPTMKFAMERKWGEVALRMLREAVRVENDDTAAENFLDRPGPLQLLLRGEAVLFEQRHASRENNTFFEYGSAMQLIGFGSHESTEELQCSWNRWQSQCEPVYQCELSNFMECVPRPSATHVSTGWWRTNDALLSSVVNSGTVAPGSSIPTDDMKGIRVTFHCGAKQDFGTEGPLEKGSDKSLLQCLKDGLQSNARIHAKEPWRIYLPEEVVVVATFEALEARKCKTVGGIKFAEKVCHDAEEDDTLDAHLGSDAEGLQGDVYVGMHAGAGFPKGTAAEVILKPENLLDAVGELFLGEPEGDDK